MNEIRRRDRDAEEIARARAIVERHGLPDFTSGFDVRLGVLDGEPALFVAYKESENERQPRMDEVLRRSEEYAKLDAAVMPELLDAFEDRMPFSIVEPETRGLRRN